jgi:hypothetical protein
MLLDAVNHWRFTPAQATGDDGVERPVEGAVLVAAVYRPPAFGSGPNLGTPPIDVAISQAVAYPLKLSTPAFPVRAQAGGVVMLEVALDEAGVPKATRTLQAMPGFEVMARDAVSQWKFRPAQRLARPVPSTAYVVLGFPTPVTIDTSQ